MLTGREVVDTIKEAFELFSEMELPLKEREVTIMHEAALPLIGYIEHLEAAQPKWISVEERLPGDPLDGVGEVVELLIDKGSAKEVLPGYYDHNEKDWVIYFGDILGDYLRKTFSWWRVIKWRPFPEPPKEETND